MKTKNLFFGVLAVASLVSCSDDKVTGISPSAKGGEITYSVVTNKATRSTLYSNSAKPESFYVWAATSGGAAYIEGDQIVADNNGTYTDVTSTRYWPSSSLDFYATNYANAKLDETSTSTFPLTFSYTVATAVADQEDLIYAVATEQSSGTVELNFRHALSQIVFQAVNEEDNFYVEITGVGVHNVSGTGSFTFPTTSTATYQEEDASYLGDGKSDWTMSTETSDIASYAITFAESESVTLEGKTEATALTSGTAETALLLLPQTTTLTGDHWNSAETNAYLTLECAIYHMAGEKYDSSNDIQLYTGTVYFPLAISWEAGKKYTYLFDFGGSGSDNPGGEDEEGNEDILVPITASVSVDDFVEEGIALRVYVVDLGLPSGLLWATCNVGASSETDLGDFYAFGEINTKSSYTTDNSTWYHKSVTEDEIKGNPLYDAATANWGAPWRLPTSAEITELVNNTTQTWTTETDSKGNTVYGCKVTSKINGSSIFFPAAGYYEGSTLSLAGSYGYYWSCSPDSAASSVSYTYMLYFWESKFILNSTLNRYEGCSVRPVCPK